MWKSIISFILVLSLKAFSSNMIELSPVQIPIEITTKKIEKREELSAPTIIQPFNIYITIEIIKYIPFVVEFSDGLPFLSIEKPKAYLGLPPSNALLSRVIDNFNSGNLIFAKADLEEFIRKYSDSPNIYYAYYLLGYTEYLKGDYIQSRENLSKSCQLKPMPENCTSAAAVSLTLNNIDAAKKNLEMIQQQNEDTKFLEEVIDFITNKNKNIKTDCNKLSIAFVDFCQYSKKYIEFANGNYKDSINIKIKKETSVIEKQSIIMDGFAYYFIGEKQKALNLFDYYLSKISITDKLSNLAYFGKALIDENISSEIAGILQTRDEEFAQQIYLKIAQRYLEKKDYFNAFLYLQSALAVYDKNKEKILKNIAVCMYNLRNYQYAKGIFKELAKTYDEPQLTLYTAFTYYNLREYPEAEKYFQKLSDNPSLKESALEYLSNIYLNMKDYENFIETASELRKLNPDKAYNLLGWYFFEKEDYTNAFKSFRDKYMKAVSAFNMGDTKTARELIEKQNDIKSILLMAFIYLKENNLQESRNILLKIKDRDDRISQEASYLYAFTYFIEGKFDVAVLEFKNFLNRYSSKNDELVKKAYLRIADSYYNMGEVDIARKLYNDFISKYSNTEDAINAAYSLLQLETKESKTDIKVAIENFITRYPNYSLTPILKIQLANIYANEKNFEKAEKLYKEIIEKNIPESETALYQYISMLDKKGDLENAKKLSLHFINRYPNSENINNIKMILAQIYEKQNSIDEALSIYYQIQEIDQVKFKIAQLLTKKKDFNQALRYFQELYTTYPENKSLAIEIGKIYYQLSQNEEASSYFQQATKSENPKVSAEGYYYLGILSKPNDLNKALNNFLNSIYINPQLDEINVNARLEAAQILIKAERRKEASCLLKEILKYNDDQIKQKAENMMKDLPKCVY